MRVRERLRGILRSVFTAVDDDRRTARWHLVVKARTNRPARAILTNSDTGEIYISQGASPVAAVLALRTDHGVDPKLDDPLVMMRKS